MDTGCLFKTMWFVLALLALPLLLFAQQKKPTKSKYYDVKAQPSTKLYKAFIKEFPEAELPYEISVDALKNSPEKSVNQPIPHQYGDIYYPMQRAMYSRIGGRTSYYFVTKLIENENYTAVLIEEREWRTVQALYSVVTFNRKGDLIAEHFLAENEYNSLTSGKINSKGEMTLTTFEKVRNDDEIYDWQKYSKLKKTDVHYVKITSEGKFETFTPKVEELVTGRKDK